MIDRVDGLIILSDCIKEKNWILELINQDKPVVIAGSGLSDSKVNCVYADNIYGGYIAAKHLIEFGHNPIAHITGDLEYQVSLERMKGYPKALIEAPMKLHPELIIEGNHSGKSGYQAMQNLLTQERRCTAVFVATDEMAFGALQAIQEAGLSVPGDISVIGYDDLEFSRYRFRL